MTKQQIIEYLAKNKKVEGMFTALNLNIEDADYKDLIQDLYLDLLNKDETLLQQLYNKDEFDYFIYRMISNNVRSKTSPFYKTYIKTKQFEDITTLYDQADKED